MVKKLSEQQVDDLIKLKFGKLVTSADHKQYASNATLGKIFGVSASQVWRLYTRRFQDIADKQLPLLLQFEKQMQRSKRQRWGLRFLRAHEINWLVDSRTLRQQIGMSLADRCQHFRKEYPAAHINPTLLSRIYRDHKVKKRAIRWYKQPKERDPEQARQQLATMKRLLTRARNDGYRVVYLDETCFTRSTVPKAEYCRQGQNVAADLAYMQEPTLAVLASISKEKGLEHYRVFDNSVNIAKFKEFLQELRSQNGDEKIALFMDNLSAHRSEKSKVEMARLGFRAIFNVPYSPEYNPIEFAFSKIKAKFRALRARKLAGVDHSTTRALVAQAVECVRKKDVVNCVLHVQKLLK